MEALLIIFVELAFLCLAPVFALIGAMFGILLELLALLFGGAFAGWSGRWKRKSTAPKVPRKPLIPRKLLHWIAGISGVVGALGVVASFVLFQPLVKFVLDAAGERAGMEISYEEASGTLLAGHVMLRGVAVKRESETGLALDVALDEAEARVSLLSLLSDEIDIPLVRIEGLAGYIAPPVPKQDKPDRPKPRKSFRADLVSLSGVEIEVRPRESEPYPLSIATAEVAPFNSKTALFALLFRSNMQAEIAGQSLRVETRKITEDGRETIWDFEDVEADRMKVIVPRAPLTWLDGGTVNVSVEDRWSLSDEWIDMDWRVTMEGVSVDVPKKAGAGEKLLARGLKAAVAVQGGDAAFRYRLELDEGQVRTLRSGDLDQFWDTVLAGFLKRDTPVLETDPDEVETKDGVRGALEKLRSAITGGEDEE